MGRGRGPGARKHQGRRGKPFIGPAGRILDRAIADAGLNRKGILVTNAAKHFRFEQRGGRRLHKKPNAHNIERCRWWADFKKKIVNPKIIVALGATAARSVMDRVITISKVRGEGVTAPDGYPVLITIHRLGFSAWTTRSRRPWSTTASLRRSWKRSAIFARRRDSPNEALRACHGTAAGVAMQSCLEPQGSLDGCPTSCFWQFTPCDSRLRSYLARLW